MRKWKVYISSTFKDLKDLRSELITLFQNQLKTSFELCEIMERMFDDGTYTPFVEDCANAVRDSDIYVIILGNKTGSYPPNETRTYTEIELDTAIEEQKFIFCLRLDTFDEAQIDNKSKHDSLLNKFAGKHVHLFKNQTELRNCVYECLFPFGSKSPINKKNPYKGLEAFSVIDGANFFGRSEEVEQCLKKILLSNENHFFSVVGNSGIGKTSFVQAGILYRLKNSSELGYSDYEQIIINPGNEPFSNLKYQLQLKGIDSKSLLDKHLDNKVILFFNQFEEIITQCHTEESIKEREQLLELLDNLTGVNFNGVIITTFRSDYSSQLANFNFISNHQTFFLLSSLDYKVNTINWESSIKEIIIHPALNNGVIMQDTLVAELVNQTKEVDGLLPILQVTLTKIWNDESIHDGIITSSEYSKLSQGKGMSGIIETHANEVVKRITNDGKDKPREAVLKSIFVNLVEVNENSLDVKKTVKKDELFERLKVYPNGLAKEVFEELVSKESRLLVVSDSKVNIIHEVLIRKWDRLTAWINERREALQYQKRLIHYIEDYNKGLGRLYKGQKLKILENWKASNLDLSNDIIDEFIKRSKTRIRSRTYQLIAGIAIGLIAIVIGYNYYVGLTSVQARQRFIDNIKYSPSLESQIKKAGGNLDSVASLNIDDNNYSILKEGIQYFKNIRHLKIESVDSLTSLSFLPAFAHLRSLELNTNTYLRSLKGIEILTGLTALSISENSGLTSFAGIETLTALESLLIEGNDSLTDLEGINALKNLKYLNIIGCDRLQDLHGIEELANLAHLEIVDNDSLEDIDNCQKLAELDYLRLVNNVRLTSLNGIEQLSGLDSLLIENSDILTFRNGIATLSGLEYLVVWHSNIWGTLKGIEKLQGLATLEISGYSDFVNNRAIENMTGLHALIISGDESLTNLDLRRIELLPNLDSLVILFNPGLTSLKGAKKLPRLRSLVIRSNDNLRSMEGIEGFYRLNGLYISNNSRLTSLKGVDQINDLKNLVISNNNSLSQLNQVSKLTNLGSLKISSNKRLTNLDDFAKLTGLHSLEISFNENLTSLKGLEQISGLKSLAIIYNNKLNSLEGIQALDSLNTLTIALNSNLTSLKEIRFLKNLKKLVIDEGYKELFEVIYELSNIQELEIPRYPIDSQRVKSKNPNIKFSYDQYRPDRY